MVEQQCWGSGITVGSFVHGSRGGRLSLGLVHQLAATDGAGDVSTPRMRVEWLPSNRERIADLGIDVWVEEQPRRWCSSTETEKHENRWEWITTNSVTRAWGVETEERDGVRTVKTWAEWLVDRPNPNQESRRGAAEGRIDWKKPWEGQEEPARNIRWEQGEDDVMRPQNTKDAIRMFAEGWLAGRNLIVVTDGGMNQNTPATGPFSTPFCHLSTDWAEQITTCGWSLAFDTAESARLPTHLVGGTRLILEGMSSSSSTIELAGLVEILSVLTSWITTSGAEPERRPGAIAHYADNKGVVASSEGPKPTLGEQRQRKARILHYKKNRLKEVLSKYGVDFSSR